MILEAATTTIKFCLFQSRSKKKVISVRELIWYALIDNLFRGRMTSSWLSSCYLTTSRRRARPPGFLWSCACSLDTIIRTFSSLHLSMITLRTMLNFWRAPDLGVSCNVRKLSKEGSWGGSSVIAAVSPLKACHYIPLPTVFWTSLVC